MDQTLRVQVGCVALPGNFIYGITFPGSRILNARGGNAIGRAVAMQELSMANSAANPAVPTLLVVEDEPLTRAMMCDELRMLGYMVIDAASADEALEIVRSPIPLDMVFTDMQMPGSLDGNELVRRIRMERPSLKLVMISGRCPEPAIISLLDGFLAKPLELSQLGACVRAFAPAHDQAGPTLFPAITASQKAEPTGTVLEAE